MWRVAPAVFKAEEIFKKSEKEEKDGKKAVKWKNMKQSYVKDCEKSLMEWNMVNTWGNKADYEDTDNCNRITSM